jgi:hypothetical protein
MVAFHVQRGVTVPLSEAYPIVKTKKSDN